MRWAGLVLGLVTIFVLPAPAAPVICVVLAAGLAATGLDLRRQAAAARPWLPMVLLLLALHTLTATEAAPLGRPSWLGLRTGVWSLARVAASVALLGVFVRASTVDAMAQGVGWWLGPRRGRAGDDVGLALAVALGTAPLMAAEGRRILAVMELRRHGPLGAGRGGRLARWRRGLADRARVVVPLLEGMARRAEGLSLALRHRRSTADLGRPSVRELAVLGIWTAALVFLLIPR